jgi:hypothetical protein
MILFIYLGDESYKLKWADEVLGKDIIHAFLVRGKRRLYEGKVISFNSRKNILHIKYKGCKDVTVDSLCDLYKDFKNGDLSLK